MKLAFTLLAVAWMLMWLLSLLTIGGVMGNSPVILLVYLGIALVPPGLLYLLLFRVFPWLTKKVKATPQSNGD